MDNFDDDKLADDDAINAMNGEYNEVTARRELLEGKTGDNSTNYPICMAELSTICSAYLLQNDILDRLVYLGMIARGPRTQDTIRRAIKVKKKTLQSCTTKINRLGGDMPKYCKTKIGAPTFHVLLEDINYLQVQLLSTLEDDDNLADIIICEQTSAIMLHYISY